MDCMLELVILLLVLLKPESKVNLRNQLESSRESLTLNRGSGRLGLFGFNL